MTQTSTATTDIEQAKKDIDEYIEECDKDATKASNNKRLGRWLNFVFGIAIAGIGFTIAYPGFENKSNEFRFGLGLANAIVGAIVTVTSQRLDPVESRQRSINLRSLVLDFERLKRNINYELIELENSPNTKTHEQISKGIYEDLDECKRKAYKLGIRI